MCPDQSLDYNTPNNCDDKSLSTLSNDGVYLLCNPFPSIEDPGQCFWLYSIYIATRDNNEVVVSKAKYERNYQATRDVSRLVESLTVSHLFRTKVSTTKPCKRVPAN